MESESSSASSRTWSSAWPARRRAGSSAKASSRSARSSARSEACQRTTSAPRRLRTRVPSSPGRTWSGSRSGTRGSAAARRTSAALSSSSRRRSPRRNCVTGTSSRRRSATSVRTSSKRAASTPCDPNRRSTSNGRSGPVRRRAASASAMSRSPPGRWASSRDETGGRSSCRTTTSSRTRTPAGSGTRSCNPDPRTVAACRTRSHGSSISCRSSSRNESPDRSLGSWRGCSGPSSTPRAGASSASRAVIQTSLTRRSPSRSRRGSSRRTSWASGASAARKKRTTGCGAPRAGARPGDPPRVGAVMKELWVEKYRPKSLDEVVGQEEIVERLKAYAKTGNLPHLLFAGPAGTGKTTSAIALARDMFGEDWRQNYFELNSSDERGIETVRTKVKEIARLAPFGGTNFKIIFLDEADNLTADAQAALRRTMETYSKTSRFILSANYSSRLIEPIQSRTAVFRFRPLKPEAIAEYIGRIAKAEKLKITDEGMEALVYVAEGDMRRAVNALQVAASLGSTVDADVLYKVSSTIRPEEVKALIEKALEGEFLRAREVLDKLLIEYGLSGEDIVRQLHRTVFDLNIPDESKVRLLDRIGETDFRLTEGSSERIQIESLLAHFALIGQELSKK